MSLEGAKKEQSLAEQASHISSYIQFSQARNLHVFYSSNVHFY